MSEQMVTAEQLKCIGALTAKLKPHDKDALISGFTTFRTSSRKEMRKSEAIKLIKYLKELDKKEKSADKMRKYMLAMAYEGYGLSKNASDAEKKNARERLDEWCVKFGHAKKRLDEHSHEELPILVTQFKKVHNQVLKGI